MVNTNTSFRSIVEAMDRIYKSEEPEAEVIQESRVKHNQEECVEELNTAVSHFQKGIERLYTAISEADDISKAEITQSLEEAKMLVAGIKDICAGFTEYEEGNL